jgi:hypothetical protein
VPVRRELRSSIAVRIAPLALLLVVIYTRMPLVDLEPYWLAVSAQASGAVVILAPVCAAVAAWEADRRRRGRVASWAPARHPLIIVLAAVWPVALLALAGFLTAAFTATTAAAGAPGWFDLRFPLVTAAVVAVFTLLGHMVGSVLRAVYAVPTMLVGTLGWLILPPTSDRFWIRHMTGNYLYECCSVETTIDPRALWAPLILAVGLVMALVLLLIRPGWPTGVVATILLVAAAGGSYATVRDLGPDPVLDRVDGLTCQEERGITICAWREHRQQLPRAALALRPAVERLTQAGFPTPTVITEQRTASATRWTFTSNAAMTDEQVVFSLASGLLPPMPDCAEHGPWPAGPLTVPVRVWLSRTAGIPRQSLIGQVDQAALDLVDQILQRPVPAQWSWFVAMRTALNGCNPLPARTG